MAGGGDADSMLWFQLERRGDRMKHCWKMKQMQRTHLGYMGRKRDTTRRCDDVSRRRGGTGEGKKGGNDAGWVDTYLTEPKNEENLHGQFSCYKYTVKI
jgi:hypothetical protein